jgi:AAA ATPase domain
LEDIKPKYLHQDDLFLPNNIDKYVRSSPTLIEQIKTDTININYRSYLIEGYINDDMAVDSPYISQKINEIKFFDKVVEKIEKRLKKQNSNEEKNQIIEVTFTDQTKITLDKEAGGFQFLFKLLVICNRIISIETKTIFLIEEPETTLHPKLQKLLPKIFQSLSNENVQFIISTHSPFIISAAANREFQESQKVYLIDKGQTVGLDFDPQNSENYEHYNSNISKNGFWGEEIKLVTTKMLGAGLNDFIPNLIICCEESMRMLIKEFINREDIKHLVKINPLIIPIGGDEKVLNQTKLAKSLINEIASLIKISHYFTTKPEIVAIIDTNVKTETFKLDLQKAHSKSSVIEIETEEQEQKYPNWAKSEFLINNCSWDGTNKFKDFLIANLDSTQKDVNNKPNKLGNSRIGIWKAEFAKLIAQKITITEFQELSYNLHNLIFI